LRKAYVAVSKAGRLLGEDAVITLGAPYVLPRPDAEARQRRLMIWPFRLGDCQTYEQLKIKNLPLKNHWQVRENPSQGAFWRQEARIATPNQHGFTRQAAIVTLTRYDPDSLALNRRIGRFSLERSTAMSFPEAVLSKR
jgi:hypothetical protein